MLKTNVCGVEFRNPLMLAAGIMGSNASSMNWILKSGAGGVVSKSFSLKPHPGYVNPTTVAVEGGIINAIGLSNPGVDNFKEELKKIDHENNVVIASIYGATPDEFSQLVGEVQEFVDMIELNISCPHAMDGYGASIGQSCDLSNTIVSASCDVAEVPVIAKLTPNVTDITEIAKTCEDAGADALSLINTLGPGMKINIDVARPVLSNKFGGMSGRAIKPIAISNVYSVYEAVDIPLIGVGGIYSWEDVVEFIYAGARAVQIGTAIMDEGVEVFAKINEGLEKFMAEKGFSSIDEMVGLAHREL
ncbi:dihydroorotate dehydrogenase [Methanobrevibacter sp. YE315]|uniref:dihydroorotate dehydrogenase n=1 Tax=Methanobrevibacter sp. YE315 TaxID=1609968 RepID=UPI000764CFCE|nr:dihydroorotate dehydrogenase [Methanobrevibacter sp. YE315]AMD18225.1 dihydroorotate dehydrogenase [Methanobrevibacter sp. YE315]